MSPDDGTAGVAGVDPATPAGPGRRRATTIAAIVGLALVPLVIVAVIVFAGSGDDDPIQYVIDVPAGTGERIDAGEQVQLMPPVLELEVGDQLLVNNDDDRIHTVGPFTVRPGDSLVQVFSEAGIIEGACTLNPSQGVKIVVT